MKIHHLRNLVAVADATSIRGAARAQGLAQPAITRGLRNLEKNSVCRCSSATAKACR